MRTPTPRRLLFAITSLAFAGALAACEKDRAYGYERAQAPDRAREMPSSAPPARVAPKELEESPVGTRGAILEAPGGAGADAAQLGGFGPDASGMSVLGSEAGAGEEIVVPLR